MSEHKEKFKFFYWKRRLGCILAVFCSIQLQYWVKVSTSLIQCGIEAYKLDHELYSPGKLKDKNAKILYFRWKVTWILKDMKLWKASSFKVCVSIVRKYIGLHRKVKRSFITLKLFTTQQRSQRPTGGRGIGLSNDICTFQWRKLDVRKGVKTSNHEKGHWRTLQVQRSYIQSLHDSTEGELNFSHFETKNN